MTKTDYKHVVMNDEGVPMIEGTRTKLVMLVGDVKNGWDAEEIHEQYPHLPLAVVHSALAYYWDHKAELDAEYDRREKYAEDLRQQMPEPELVKRIRRMREQGGA
jgi:uncharacterized protein (DUF433 family)